MVPLNCIAFYCLLRKTPDYMLSVRTYLLLIQVNIGEGLSKNNSLFLCVLSRFSPDKRARKMKILILKTTSLSLFAGCDSSDRSGCWHTSQTNSSAACSRILLLRTPVEREFLSMSRRWESLCRGDILSSFHHLHSKSCFQALFNMCGSSIASFVSICFAFKHQTVVPDTSHFKLGKVNYFCSKVFAVKKAGRLHQRLTCSAMFAI